MTIACAYLVSDGVALGADSTTTVMLPTAGGQGAIGQLLNHAQKLFAIGPEKQSRLALCTWGSGRVGQTSHRTLASRLSDEILVHQEWTIGQAAEHFRHLVVEAAREPPGCPGVLGYFLAGIDPFTHTPRCHEIQFINGTAIPEGRALAQGEFRVQGNAELFSRAFHGFDPALPPLLLQNLIMLAQQDTPPAALPPQFPSLFTRAFQAAVNAIPHGGLQDVPIREAIDFCHMHLHLTVKGHKFRFGPPMCGGPIELGFLTTDRPFRWARHKPFDSAIIEHDLGES
jgi:hypothetical protein